MSGGMEAMTEDFDGADANVSAWIEREIAEEEAGFVGPQQEGAEQQAGQDQAEQWAMIPAMIGSALSMALPELRGVYSEDACRAWGAAMVPVSAKYGWDADSIMGPEVGLLCASLPLAVGTFAAVSKAKAKALDAARAAKPAPAAVESPSDKAKTVQAGTVTFGPVQEVPE